MRMDKVSATFIFVAFLGILVLLFLTFETVTQVNHNLRDLMQQTSCVCKESLDGGP